MKHSPFIVSNFEIKSIKEDDPEYYMVEGYGSVYGNVDSYRDIVMPGAFGKDLSEKGNERTILWQHRSDKPIGTGVFEERSDGLYAVMKMPKASDFVAKEVMPLIKCRAVKGLSIGYWTVKEEYDRTQNVNRLTELKLRELSCVTFPANEEAQITAAKQFLGIEDSQGEKSTNFTMYPLADENTAWDSTKAVQQIRENTGSTDEPSSNYKKGFMYYDPENTDKFAGYKLPYVYYIDGGFKIVPRAIYAIAGVLAGARGGVNIPDSDKTTIKGYINRVYKKMGKEEPFKSAGKFFVDRATLKFIDAEDLDMILGNENVILSSGAKEEIITALRSPGSEGSVPDIDDYLKSIREMRKSFEGETNG
jgi:HK97 family phage prohead protease